MPTAGKSDRLTPSKQTRKTSSNYGQGSPSNESHDSDSLDAVKRELVNGIEIFLKFRQEWDELVLNRSLSLVVKIMELEAEIRSTVENSCFLQKCPEDEVTLKDGYAWKQFCKLNAIHFELKGLLGDMTKLAFKIEELNEYFEALIRKSCTTHGTVRIFDGPIGLTWPLPRMSKVQFINLRELWIPLSLPPPFSTYVGDHLMNLSSQYLHSLQFHHSLYDVIVSQDTPVAEKQATVSYWACQPLMYDKNDLKDLLEVEFSNSFNGPNSLTPRKPTQKKALALNDWLM
ncbi:hypothetical protein PSHT_03456 [Puccinia striiformis]|uniref:Uncharacterized protein n=1 Tax=Puccinia striiformis TaxID=27350 RepID=A0A2S4WFD3_9BASI|nr:hypothetical protein PSHT_03456 [Puccinia striiformis]